MHYATFNHVWASLLLEELYRWGLREVVVAPGSRSTPLTMAASEHAGLRCHTHFDERGLGFMALGLARGAQQPVAVITTSGTAVANLYPAVVEAALLGVPLVILSADRPIELLDNGSNQAIDQRDIFARHTVAHHDLPTPSREIPAAYLLSTIDQTMARQHRLPGPVHFNCRYREPLYPSAPPVAASDYLAPLSRWQHSAAPWSAWQTAPAALPVAWPAAFTRQRGVIVVGRIDDPQQAAPIAALAEQLGWPLLADLQSQLYGDPRHLVHMDLALQDPQVSAELGRANVLLQFGGRLISKRLTQMIASHPWQQAWLVDPLPQRLDPDFTLTQRLVCTPAEAIATLPAGPAQPPWHTLARLQQRTRQGIERYTAEFSELGVCHQVAQLARGALFVGNSLPARLMNMLGSTRSTPLRVMANRGASGIDGLLATAYGLACTTHEPTTVILGDTSALHDLNSLALLARAKAPLVVVVLNNDGGSIFHMLPVPDEGDLLERYYRQPHGLAFEHAARMFHLNYAAPTTLAAFCEAYTQALEAGVTLIEVTVPHQQATGALQALGAWLQEAAHAS